MNKVIKEVKLELNESIWQSIADYAKEKGVPREVVISTFLQTTWDLYIQEASKKIKKQPSTFYEPRIAPKELKIEFDYCANPHCPKPHSGKHVRGTGVESNGLHFCSMSCEIDFSSNPNTMSFPRYGTKRK